jgi:hypothetical protein
VSTEAAVADFNVYAHVTRLRVEDSKLDKIQNLYFPRMCRSEMNEAEAREYGSFVILSSRQDEGIWLLESPSPLFRYTIR